MKQRQIDITDRAIEILRELEQTEQENLVIKWCVNCEETSVHINDLCVNDR